MIYKAQFHRPETDYFGEDKDASFQFSASSDQEALAVASLLVTYFNRAYERASRKASFSCKKVVRIEERPETLTLFDVELDDVDMATFRIDGPFISRVLRMAFPLSSELARSQGYYRDSCMRQFVSFAPNPPERSTVLASELLADAS